MKKLFFIFLIVNCTFIIENYVGQWEQCSGINGGLIVYTLAVSGRNPGSSRPVIFAGTQNYGVHLSKNSGTNGLKKL